MTAVDTSIVLQEASPRDREVQEVVLRLVEAFAFNEARVVLEARLKEISNSQQSHIEAVFLDWSRLPKEDRPEFLTYAHHRRDPQIGECRD